jgi:hypothetical protein
MTVNAKTLKELPIGTLFHNIDSSAVYEIVGYTQYEDDIYIIPLFHGEDMERRRLGLSDMTMQCLKEARFYVLNREDKNKIARKMGFEAAGIKVIGIKQNPLDNDSE